MTERLKILLLLAPALLVIGGLFGGGLLLGLIESFGYMPLLGQTELNLEAYRAIFASQSFWSGLGLSLYISTVSTVIAGGLAIAAALVLRRAFKGRGIIRFLFQINLTVPHLVGAAGILYLFSQSGLFARLAHALGLIGGPSDFPALVFDPLAIGIILQYVWKEVPFIALILLANMQAIGRDYESVARCLGAGPVQVFRHVLLPLILPALFAGSMIIFAFTFGAYEIPALLGETYPAPLPVLAYRAFTDVDLARRPEALAMAMIIAGLATLILAGYAKLFYQRGGING
ncbi:MAG: ABC transporter permease subunit [Alphaproteobacteria bacterium]|nr:MAG: ABC transporter permease subunit [Alphaproteobacteria bacterium]